MAQGNDGQVGQQPLTPERYRRVQEVLDQAWQLRAGQRQAFIEAAFGSDVMLVNEAVGLLRARQDLDAADQGLAAGTRLGAYRVERKIGRGGMGEVYLAKRADQIYERDVAIKVIRADVDHAEIAARFKLELRILASLEHPNIARLIDAGALDDGRPYIIMEYIDGIPITDYADRARLSVRDRMQLFKSVCAAVHQAHKHSVVHRDIKPSNILVTPAGVPKLLDFGIAKVLTPGGQEALRLTATDLTPGTPLYASPEQLAGTPLDARADIYALGVVLSELLSGTLPFVPAQDADGRIRIRPSHAVQQSVAMGGNESNVVARASARATTPTKLVRQLRGDVDAIVMRAVQDQPHERYATAAELSDDLDRCLRGVPVDARPRTVGYAVTSAIRRRPVLAGATAVVIVAAGVLLSSAYGAGAPNGSLAEPPSGPPSQTPTVSPNPTVPAPSPSLSPTPPPPARTVPVEVNGPYAFEIWDGKRLIRPKGARHTFEAVVGQTIWLRAPEFFLNDAYRIQASSRHIEAPELAKVYFNGPPQCHVKRATGDILFSKTELVAIGKRDFTAVCPPGMKALDSQSADVRAGTNVQVKFR